MALITQLTLLNRKGLGLKSRYLSVICVHDRGIYKNSIKKFFLSFAPFLLLGVFFLPYRTESAALVSPLYPVPTAYRWESSDQLGEKWFISPREEDEWYKRRQKQKYRIK